MLCLHTQSFASPACYKLKAGLQLHDNRLFSGVVPCPPSCSGHPGGMWSRSNRTGPDPGCFLSGSKSTIMREGVGVDVFTEENTGMQLANEPTEILTRRPKGTVFNEQPCFHRFLVPSSDNCLRRLRLLLAGLTRWGYKVCQWQLWTVICGLSLTAQRNLAIVVGKDERTFLSHLHWLWKHLDNVWLTLMESPTPREGEEFWTLQIHCVLKLN